MRAQRDMLSSGDPIRLIPPHRGPGLGIHVSHFQFKGNLAHNFVIFHSVVLSCLLNLLETYNIENNETIYINSINREKKS